MHYINEYDVFPILGGRLLKQVDDGRVAGV